MSIIEYVYIICQLQMIVSDVSHTFAMYDLEVSSSLTYVPLITGITFESINSIFFVIFICCPLVCKILDVLLVALYVICELACLNKLVAFLSNGLWQVNVTDVFVPLVYGPTVSASMHALFCP